jgi:hypothetical protein
MTRAYLKCADEAEWLALRDAHLADANDLPLPGVEIDEIGAVSHTTGETTVVDGMTVPTTVPVPGWLVNLTVSGDFPAALRPYCVNPAQPRRVWFGSYTLAMPEVLEDDGDTVLIERSIGAQCTDQQRDAAEIDYVRAKLTAEQREDRRALREAALAVVVQRAARNVAAAERDRLTALVTQQDAERDALIAQRAAEIVKRDEAVASLVGKIGFARTPFIAARDAATAEITRLAALITTANADTLASKAARVVAADMMIAANVELLRLRAVVTGMV